MWWQSPNGHFVLRCSAGGAFSHTYLRLLPRRAPVPPRARVAEGRDRSLDAGRDRPSACAGVLVPTGCVTATVMRAVLGAMGEPEDAFDWVRDRPGHDRRYDIDSSKLRRELGWVPSYTDFAGGLSVTIGWYRENEAWRRPTKEATEAKYAAQGQ